MKRNMGKKNNNLNYRRFELIFRNKRTSILFIFLFFHEYIWVNYLCSNLIFILGGPQVQFFK